MFFPAINKNLNREILTKNLITFRRWDGVDEKRVAVFRKNLKLKDIC